jgi:hypothetical protein
MGSLSLVQSRFLTVLRALIPLLIVVSQQFAARAVVWTEKFAQDAEKEFIAAKTNYYQHPGDLAAACNFGRAAFDHAEFVHTDEDRERVALQAIAICREAVQGHDDSAAAHYYLAMNLGQLARTKTLGALKLVKEMEKEFKRSAELDKTFDYAGAERSLGILYLEAPGWPTSIGNKGKARVHLLAALRLAPNYPENHLSLLEAYAKWEETDSLIEGMQKYRKMLSAAREEFKGADWEDSWADWNERYKALLVKSSNIP